MFSSVIKLFKADTTAIPNTKEKKEVSLKNIVSRYSNGNISLQKSNYITKKQLVEKQAKIFAHRFA